MRSKRELLKYYLNKRGISTTNIGTLIDMGLISEKAIIRYLVREEYVERKGRNNHYVIQAELSTKYFVSIATVQNYIYS